MVKKIIFFMFLIIITATYFTFQITSKNNLDPSGLINECLDCEDGNRQPFKREISCCTSDFEKKCTKKGGLVSFEDLHPVSSFLKVCYPKAKDANKACSTYNECQWGCDLESAISTGKCKLIDKTYTGGESFGEKFYTAKYLCNSEKPGICLKKMENRVNPGGISTYLTMEKNILTEKVAGGPIH